jgi:iron-sulfur cluster assembly protein
VKFTPTALVKLHEIQQEFSIKGVYLRVAVVPAAAGGFVYDMKVDAQLDPTNDYLCDSEGIQILVDKRSALFLEGATIDWQTTPDGRQGFKFDNPNAVKQ